MDNGIIYASPQDLMQHQQVIKQHTAPPTLQMDMPILL